VAVEYKTRLVVRRALCALPYPVSALFDAVDLISRSRDLCPSTTACLTLSYLPSLPVFPFAFIPSSNRRSTPFSRREKVRLAVTFPSPAALVSCLRSSRIVFEVAMLVLWWCS
jgi:hypothetical protein